MFPKKGRSFPAKRDKHMEAEFAQIIASALKVEFGSTKHGTKTIMRWTGVGQRTAKNWLSGVNAPSGYNLVLLARESNAVLKAMMLLADRPEMSLGSNLISLRRMLADTITALDEYL
jgi:hypothetical protein